LYNSCLKVAKCRQDLYIPNALTPNSGDNNSIWDISKLRLTSNSEVKIFNRYGTIVYSSSGDKMNAWDGGNLAAGTYYYVIDFNDGIVPKKTGAVTIIK
jgi:gliding motility-associated-like protein